MTHIYNGCSNSKKIVSFSVQKNYGNAFHKTEYPNSSRFEGKKKRQKRLHFKVFAIVQLESLYCSKRFQLKKVPMCMQSSPKREN